MAILTDQDKQFILKLKGQGYSKEDAFAALTKVKQAKGDETFSFGERFMQNLKKAPEALFGAGTVTGETLGKIPLVKNVVEGVKDFGSMASEGIARGVEGATAVAQGLTSNKPISEKVPEIVSGAADVVGGALSTMFAAPVARATNLPLVGGIAESALNTVGEGVKIVSKAAGDYIGQTSEEKDALAKNFENLMMLFGAKYGDKAAESVVEAMKPYVTKGVEAIKQDFPAVANFAGKSLKNVANYLEEKVLPTTAKEAELMQKFEANKMIAEEALAAAKKNGDVAKITEAKKSLDSLLASKPRTIAETSTERGISGTRTGVGLSSAKTGTTIFTKEINPALKATKETITRDELFKPLEDKIADTVEPGRKAELEAALEAIKEEYASPAFDNLTLEVAQKIKSGLDEFTPQKAFKGQEIANGYNQLRAEMANAIRRATYDKLKSQDIKNKYLDYSNLLELQKLGIKARMEKGAGFALGGFASQIRTLWDMAATPLGTAAGKYLYKLGDLLEFESPVKVKTAGEFIESQGVSKNEFYDQVRSSYEKTGGITINLQGGIPRKGYAFAPSKTSEFKISTDVFEKDRNAFIDEFISKNKQTLSQPGSHFGLWRSDDGFVYMDIIQVVADLAQAKKAAKASNQLAIYDLEKNEAISLD